MCFIAGSELILGPWSHGGLTDQDARVKTSFNQPQHSLDFINKCCGHKQPAAQPPLSNQQPAAPQQPRHNPSAALLQTDTAPAPQTDANIPLSHHQRSVSNSQPEADTQLLSQPESDSQQQTVPSDMEQQHQALDRQMHTQPPTEDPLQATNSTSADFCPVHYFLMGQMTHRKWRHSSSWPPSGMQPVRLYLTAGKQTGPSSSLAVGHGGSCYLQVQHNGSASNLGQISLTTGAVGNSPGIGSGPVRNGLGQGQDENSSVLSSSCMQQPTLVQNGACEQELAGQSPTEVVQVEHSYRQAMQMGELSWEKQSHWIRFRHEVHLQKPLKVQLFASKFVTQCSATMLVGTFAVWTLLQTNS